MFVLNIKLILILMQDIVKKLLTLNFGENWETRNENSIEWHNSVEAKFPQEEED